MKVIRLSQDTILDGIRRAKGEHVLVPDAFNDTDLISRVVAVDVDKQNKAAYDHAVTKEAVRIVGKQKQALKDQIASLDAGIASLTAELSVIEEKLKTAKGDEKKALQEQKKAIEDQIKGKDDEKKSVQTTLDAMEG